MDWREMLVSEVEKYLTDPAHTVAHSERVYKYAEQISSAEGGDLDILYAASYLHDIGREEEKKSDEPHEIISSRIADKILHSINFPEEKIAAVKHVILSHETYSDIDLGKTPPETIEDYVFQDADRLDALGKEGCERTIAYGGSWRPVYDPSAKREYVLDLSKDNAADSLIVIETYIHRYDTGVLLNTETAKKIAEDKIEYMRGFVDGAKQPGVKYYAKNPDTGNFYRL